MRSIEVVGWVVLVNVSLLAACGGVSSIGSGAGGEPGMGMGGSKTAGGPGTLLNPKAGSDAGAAGNRYPSSGGASASGSGNTTPGVAGAPSETMAGSSPGQGLQSCKTSEECPGANEPCQKCPGGELACNYGYCEQGICKRNGGFCAPQCTGDTDCPVPDLACTECSDGARACPTSQCRLGLCEVSYPGCSGFDPCKGLGCGSPCQSCQPGTCQASVASYCNDAGKCQPGAPACGQNKCLTVMDCGTPPPVCTPCTDGSCASFDCVGNKCVWSCKTSSLQCKYADECLGLFDNLCTKCPSRICAVPACIQNSCELVCPV